MTVISGNFLGNMVRVRQLALTLDEWGAIRERVYEAARQGDFATAEKIVRTEGTPKFHEILPIVHYVVDFAKEKARTYVRESDAEAQIVVTYIKFAAAIIVLLIALSAALIANQIGKNLVSLREADERHHLEQVLRENELERQKDVLERTVAERTHELTRTTVKAEAANEAKTAFLGNMSHELRTPLHQITGLAALVRSGPLTAEQTGYIDLLDLSTKRLTLIVDGILQLTEIEANRVLLAQEPVDVERLLTETAKAYRTEAEAKGLELHVESSTIVPAVLGDAARLGTALANYVGNALRFTQSGGIFLRARIVAEEAGAVLLRFEVEDTGVGIVPDVLQRLFSIFEQVDNSSTRKYGGTGLGLAMTRKLAILMGGDAGCESIEGVGSTFWFTARLRMA